MSRPPLTPREVEAVTRHLPGGAAPARLLEEKDRNQVFAVGEQAIFKVHLSDGRAKQARKIAALEFLAGATEWPDTDDRCAAPSHRQRA